MGNAELFALRDQAACPGIACAQIQQIQACVKEVALILLKTIRTVEAVDTNARTNLTAQTALVHARMALTQVDSQPTQTIAVSVKTSASSILIADNRLASAKTVPPPLLPRRVTRTVAPVAIFASIPRTAYTASVYV